jgi:diguanylate cyclase (GGDEF)-like protein
MSNLRWANMIAAVLITVFSVFFFFSENNLIKTKIYLIFASVALLLCIFTSKNYYQFNKNKKHINNWIVYLLVFLYYANIILFGLYLAVWANPEKISGSFIGIFICALFLINMSPVLYLCLTLITMIIYIIIVAHFKISSLLNYDIQNIFFAGTVTLIFGWQITMNRLRMLSTSIKLENERNHYYNQSTIDELTQLKNRRDFMQTFQRFHSNYRQSDHFLCIAIMDIDYFKNFNDHYGHSKGDECLRMIGKILKDLHDNSGIYAARVGGEEFAMLWFEEKYVNANNVAARINKTIRGLNIPHEKSEIVPYVTVSIGLHITRCGSSYDIRTLYDFADKSLYAAKKKGRNCTVIDSSS